MNFVLQKFYEKYNNNKKINQDAYVDDLAIAECVKVGTIPKMQEILDDMYLWTSELKMKLNPKKCIVLLIDFTKKQESRNVKLTINNEELPVKNETKLLGVQMNSKGNWDTHIPYIVTNASKRIFMLRRLKYFGFTKDDLILIYISYIRPLLEYSSQLWSSSITQSQIKSIISVEKRCLGIILGKFVNSSNYDKILSDFNCTSIRDRMEKLFLEFGISLFKSIKFNPWISSHLIESTRSRRCTDIFRTIQFKTERYGNCSIPQIIRALNTCDPKLLGINEEESTEQT